MKILPKKPFTWILLGVLVYAYATSPFTPEIKKEIEHSTGDIFKKTVKSSDEDTSFFDQPANKIFEKISKTETGSTVINALVKKSLDEKYGNKDLSVVSAEHYDRLLTLDRIKGDGQEAVCGSTATIKYDATIDDSISFDKSSEPVTLKIGGGKMIKGLENGLLGMKKGGKRKIAIPARLAYDDPDFRNDMVAAGKAVMFEVELVDLKGGQDAANVAMSIEDKKPGSGVEVFCGSTVTVNYKTDGEKDYRNLSFTMGEEGIPVGLEKGLMEMKTGGIRLINLPSELLKTRGKSILASDLKLPANENVVFEVELVGVE